MKMQGSAAWRGGFRDGKGTISTESGALDHYPYEVASRFGLHEGCNPEELLGAAQASCFTMAFSRLLDAANLVPDQIDTAADVTLEQVGEGFEIVSIHLTCKARIPGATPDVFQTLAETAKIRCPVLKLMKNPVSLEAELLD